MPRVPHKKIKIIIQSACHIIKKGDSACHLSENAQMGILKQFFFTRIKFKKFFLQGVKPKVIYITGCKSLLTIRILIELGKSVNLVVYS